MEYTKWPFVSAYKYNKAVYFYNQTEENNKEYNKELGLLKGQVTKLKNQLKEAQKNDHRDKKGRFKKAPKKKGK